MHKKSYSNIKILKVKNSRIRKISSRVYKSLCNIILLSNHFTYQYTNALKEIYLYSIRTFSSISLKYIFEEITSILIPSKFFILSKE